MTAPSAFSMKSIRRSTKPTSGFTELVRDEYKNSIRSYHSQQKDDEYRPRAVCGVTMQEPELSSWFRFALGTCMKIRTDNWFNARDFFLLSLVILCYPQLFHKRSSPKSRASSQSQGAHHNQHFFFQANARADLRL